MRCATGLDIAQSPATPRTTIIALDRLELGLVNEYTLRTENGVPNLGSDREWALKSVPPNPIRFALLLTGDPLPH